MTIRWTRTGSRTTVLLRRALPVTGMLIVAATMPLSAASFVGTTTSASNQVATGTFPDVVVVNSTRDTSDASAGDGVCSTGSTNTAGATECTLRAALQEANASGIVDTILFVMPSSEAGYNSGGAYWQITPTSALPTVTAPVLIDATSQPGYVAPTSMFPAVVDGRPAVRLRGGSVPSGTPGLSLGPTGDNTEIRGLSITGFVGGVAAAVLINQADNARVVGNFIGVAPDGSNNGNVMGVDVLSGTTNVVVGTAAATDRNLIRANTYGGLVIHGVGTSGIVARGNEIDSLNAASYAVVAFDGASTTIGGPGIGDGNLITRSTAQGVFVDENSVNAQATIIGNNIWSNGALGIDLLPYGVNANDALDSDTGPNNRLNFPVITGTSRAGTVVTVNFTLDVPAGSYRIEAFTNPSGTDGSGYGEGEIYETFTTITHTGGGSQAFSMTYDGAAADQVALTTTVDLGGWNYGGTSEFSLTTTVS